VINAPTRRPEAADARAIVAGALYGRRSGPGGAAEKVMGMRMVRVPAARKLLPIAAASCAALSVGLAGAVPAVGSLSRVVPARPAAAGAQLWLSDYNGPGDGFDIASSVVVSPDGKTAFVTGYSQGSASAQDYATVAYDTSTGAQRWVSRYTSTGAKNDEATALAVSPDGRRVYVTGHTWGSGPDYGTVAYNAATGRQLWVARYTGTKAGGIDNALAVKVSPDGRTVFVAGTSEGDFATVAYDASTGALRWAERYGHGNGSVAGLSVTPDGRTVFVTGQYRSGTYDGFGTVAYNAVTGAQLWASGYNPPDHGTGIPAAVAVSSDGGTVIVTGRFVGETNAGFQYSTVAYDAATGAQRWARNYDAHADAFDWSTAVAVSPGGNAVYVTGFSTGTTTKQDYATVAYQITTGQELWARRYNGPASKDDDANAIAVSPDGSTVYVTGFSDSTSVRSDYATVAYNAATGALLWASRSHRSGVAYSIAVGPGGHTVFVTGGRNLVRSGAPNDYVTVAYRT
jgi:outer membrane protein assembly factor BamB